jgi:hypothetical protein
LTRTALGYTDLMRAELAAAGIKGKRLTYRRRYKQDQVKAHYAPSEAFSRLAREEKAP